jgi:hypothetical protein
MGFTINIQHLNGHSAMGWAECLIKAIKHGVTVISAMPKNVDYWDDQLAKVMFGYICGI